jgi:hypothetical protein
MKAADLILSSTHQIGVTGGRMETRVTLKPGDKGTKRMVERFGERLICVRYRYDVARKMRYKTVELIIDEAPWHPASPLDQTQGHAGRPPALVGVRVRYEEAALRHTVKEAGGRWDQERKLWIVPLRIARRLGLEARVVAVPDKLA